MTDNELKFLLTQWGQTFTTSVITDIANNITKTPNDSVVLAVALKWTNKRIDDLITTLKTLQTQQSDSGFDVVPIVSPSAPEQTSGT